MSVTADGGDGDWFAAGIENYMDNFLGEAQRVLDEANKKLGPDADADGIWEIHDPEMAPDFLLDCPCGHTIEQDGKCPMGHVSPLRAGGLV